MAQYRDLTGLNAIVYGRKSSIDPRNPTKSVDDQRDAGTETATRAGLKIVSLLEDNGIGVSRHSAPKVREGFNEAMRLIRAGDPKIDVLVMWALSRGTRELGVFAQLLNDCEKFGVLLLIGGTLKDPADPDDRMSLGIQAVVDAAESDKIRLNVMRGMASSGVAGRPHGKNIYGYRRVYHPNTRALIEVVLEPDEAAIIREIGMKLIAGIPSRTITRDLNRRGLTRPKGGPWHHSDIAKICRRPTYVGQRSHKGVITEAIWPAIFTADEFEQLQTRLGRNSRGVHATSAKHMLTGVVFCDACDHPMYRQPSRNYTTRLVVDVYRCDKCKRSRVADKVEAYVLDVVNGWLADPEYRVGLQHLQANPDTTLLTSRLLDLTAERDQAYESGLSVKGLISIEARVLPEIADLEARLATILVNADAATFLNSGATSLPEDLDQCRTILRSLVRVRLLKPPLGSRFDYASISIKPTE